MAIWGCLAFAASEFVAFTRVESKQHHWYDTLGSSGVAAGYALLTTSRLRERNHIRTGLVASSDGGELQVAEGF